jgi:hypothetical protein
MCFRIFSLLLPYIFLSCSFFSISLFAEVKNVAPGITYEYVRTDNPESPFYARTQFSIHILRVDSNQFTIQPIRALNNGIGRETLSSIMERTGALCGINGSFFKIGSTFDGQTMSMLKINGQWISRTKKLRAAIGWKKDLSKVLVDRILLEPSIKINGRGFCLRDFNKERLAEEAILYSWAFHRTTLTNPKGTEVLIQNNKVVDIRRGKGDSNVPMNGYVYSIAESAPVKMSKIKLGMPVEISFLAIPHEAPHEISFWQEFDHIVGGTPLLIKDGKTILNYDLEQTIPTFITTRHARTAIGVMPDNTWVFVVVDGKNPAVSLGMTMPELAAYMASLGCSQAINLDGGGSSTLTIGTQVVNNPVGDEDESLDKKIERPIADAIIVLPKQN